MEPFIIPTGLIPDLPDERDFLYSDVLRAGAAPLDWEKGFNAFNQEGLSPISQDQGWSSSCVAQSSAPHIRIWIKRLLGQDIDFSRRFIYSQIALGYGYGAYLRDAVRLLSTFGDCTESDMPSYEHGQAPSEDFMLSKEGMTEEVLKQAKTFDLFNFRMIPGLTDDIDVYAHAIQNHCGVIGGFIGSNNGWTQPLVSPPVVGERTWNHAVFLSGYGLYQGRKCLFTKNSWGDRYTIAAGPWAGHQAIPEDYFSAGLMTAAGFAKGAYVFNSWVLVPNDDLTPKQKTMDFLKKNEGKLVQNVEGNGEFGIIKGGKILVADKTRAADLALTYIMRKEGLALPKDLWKEIEKDEKTFGPRK